MNQQFNMPTPSIDATRRSLHRVSTLALAVMVVAVALFISYGPAVPTMAQAEPGAITSVTLDSHQPGQLVITWETPDPAPTDYRVSWAHTSLGFLSYKDSNEAQRANVYPAAGVNTLTINDLTPGDTYKVQMRSRYYNADRSVHAWSGPWTATTTQRVKNHPPAAPTGLTTSEVTHDSLILSWDKPNDANITGYRIQRGTDANSLHTIEANTGSPSTNYADSTVEPQTTYHYAVLALSQDGNGARSSTSVTTLAEPGSEDPPNEQPVQNDPPEAPTGLTASSIEHDSLTLTWDDPQDDTITAYQVLRGASEDNLSTLEPDTGNASTAYTDSTTAAETTYFYAVTALSADGDSTQSSAISVTTPAEPQSAEQPVQNDPPAAPTGLTASRTSHDQPDPHLGQPPGRQRNRVPDSEGNRLQEPADHRGEHQKLQSELHRQYRGRGNRILLPSRRAERGHRESKVGHHRRRHPRVKYSQRPQAEHDTVHPDAGQQHRPGDAPHGVPHSQGSGPGFQDRTPPDRLQAVQR